MQPNLPTPAIMGILNVTPDSFSDGGDFLGEDAALSRALKMAEEGADIIDVGGESSRPGSEPVSAEEELKRVLPVIRGIKNAYHPHNTCHPRESGDPVHLEVARQPTMISIDTTKAVVAREALSAGANMINDISAGTADLKMFSVAAEAGVPICLMHMRGTPKTMQTGEISYNDVVGEILAYLRDRKAAAIKAGIAPERVIVDPGIGFGKTVRHNLTILRELGRLKELDSQILIGVSRKSFLGTLTGIKEPKDRLFASLAALAIAHQNGATIFRVHDVRPTMEFLGAFSALKGAIRTCHPRESGDLTGFPLPRE